MANFFEAFNYTMEYEGLYSNDPVDFGGETYRGISRRYNPSWAGWSLIDAHKSSSNFPKNLETDKILISKIYKFYKSLYWDKFLGDFILDQRITNELFDCSVHLGIYRAVRYLQIGLNLLNRNQLNYPDLIEDGDFGPKTFQTLQKYLELEKYESINLYKIMLINRGNHYITFMRKSKTQEKFARGWISRLKINNE